MTKTNEGEIGNPNRRQCSDCFLWEEETDKYLKWFQQLIYDSLKSASSLVFSLQVRFGLSTKLLKWNTVLFMMQKLNIIFWSKPKHFAAAL